MAGPNGNGAPVARVGSRNPMPLQQLQYYNPNRPDSTEAIWQPQYDFQAYGTAGSTSFTFFQVPIGQSSKTYADTNMNLAGQFPAPTAMLVTAIMVPFFPGANASITGTAAAAISNANDVVAVANAGWLEFKIGSKTYLYDAPIGKFPPNFTVGGPAAVSLGLTSQTSISYFRAQGRYYEITPFLIPMNQNFSVTLNFPTAVAVTTTGRIGVILDGFYYRQSQ